MTIFVKFFVFSESLLKSNSSYPGLKLMQNKRHLLLQPLVVNIYQKAKQARELAARMHDDRCSNSAPTNNLPLNNAGGDQFPPPIDPFIARLER